MKNTFEDILRKRIANLIDESNYTQKEVAFKLKIDNSALSRIINGTRKISSDELNRVSDIFNVSTDYLLGKTENRNIAPSDNATLIAAHIEPDATDEDMAKILDYIEMVKKSKNK